MGICVHTRRYCLAVGLTLVFAGHAAIAAERARPLITQAIDENTLVTLEGNTRPEATTANDRGAVADTMKLDHMMLQLQRSPEREAAFDRMIDTLQDPASAHYHHWLEPAQIGADYGLAEADRAKIKSWLNAHGFRVNFTYSSSMVIDFSGSAGQVRAAFHTELHRLDVSGQPHIANMTDPRIPAALAPAIVGIVALNDFPPRAEHEFDPDLSQHCPNKFGICDSVTPADLATIYNFNPQFNAGITGKGQRIAVVNLSDLGNPADWMTFRKTYGLAQYSDGSLTQTHPQPRSGASNCIDPGVLSYYENEATLDIEWSSAAAPDAHIVLAVCKDTTTQRGLVVAVLNLEDEAVATRPQIINISYGNCEANAGTAHNAAFASAYQTAVAEGISIFVSAGDTLSAGCDLSAHGAQAAHGLAVNGHASTAYNVAVGGTDFGDTYNEVVGKYWRTTNSAVSGSAKSYIPEIAWNSSCASALTAYFYDFPTAPYGTASFCNSASAEATYLNSVFGGGGGASGCAKGKPSVQGIVGGTCAGYPTPSWQKNVPGLPANGRRNLPDVSMFAAARSPWQHSYVICATTLGGCLPGSGGTSFASPIMAGVQALVNQKMNAAHGEGNPNVAYYQLAATEYGSATAHAACNSSKGNTVGKSCIFYDVTEGDIVAPCEQGRPDCFAPAGAIGALSTSGTSYKAAYQATPGWDFATGLGSVNVSNLVEAWHTVQP